MSIKIDWDNYEVIEAEDYTQADIDNTIECVREELNFNTAKDNLKLEDLLEELLKMEED